MSGNSFKALVMNEKQDGYDVAVQQLSPADLPDGEVGENRIMPIISTFFGIVICPLLVMRGILTSLISITLIEL